MSRIVFPGQVIADKPVRASYTYTDGVKTYATVTSLMSDEGKLVPLEGPYEPLAEDVVIGFVCDVKFAGYNIDLGEPFVGFLSSRDTRATFALGDIVQVRIINVDEVKSLDLADGRKLENGKIEKISPVKVPRLIGKRNSMINMIAYASGCQIIVGRNGFIFISHSGNRALACKAIEFVEANAHTSGLTDRVAAMLTEACGKPVSPDVIAAPASMPHPSHGGFGHGERHEFGSRREHGGRGERRGPREGGRREGGFGGHRQGGRPFGHRREHSQEGQNQNENNSPPQNQNENGNNANAQANGNGNENMESSENLPENNYQNNSSPSNEGENAQ